MIEAEECIFSEAYALKLRHKTPPARSFLVLSFSSSIHSPHFSLVHPIILTFNKPSKLSFNLQDTLKLFLTTYRLFIMLLASISSLLFTLLIMQTDITVSALPISGTITVASACFKTGQASDSNRNSGGSNCGSGYNVVPLNNTSASK